MLDFKGSQGTFTWASWEGTGREQADVIKFRKGQNDVRHSGQQLTLPLSLSVCVCVVLFSPFLIC